MTHITKNFTLKELTHTIFSFKNEPSTAQIQALEYLCINVLQPLRDKLKQKIIINSAFRSRQLNAACGGKSTSQHLKGEAADITCLDNRSLFRECIQLPDYDQLIIYSRYGIEIDFIHISISKTKQNRKQILYCNRLKNKYYSDFKKAFPNQKSFL